MRPYLYLAIFVSIVQLSCTEEVEDSIAITFDRGFVYEDASLHFGENYFIDVLINTRGENNAISAITILIDDEIILDTNMNTKSINFRHHHVKDEDLQTKWTFNAKDISDNRATEEITVSLRYRSLNALDSLTVFAAQNEDEGSLFSSDFNISYKAKMDSTNSKFVDMICFYHENLNRLSLFSPDQPLPAEVEELIKTARWPEINSTEFFELAWNDTDLYDIQNDSALLFTYLNDIKTIKKIERLNKKSFYGFKTKDLKFGALRIDSVLNRDTGFVNISIKTPK